MPLAVISWSPSSLCLSHSATSRQGRAVAEVDVDPLVGSFARRATDDLRVTAVLRSNAFDWLPGHENGETTKRAHYLSHLHKHQKCRGSGGFSAGRAGEPEGAVLRPRAEPQIWPVLSKRVHPVLKDMARAPRQPCGAADTIVADPRGQPPARTLSDGGGENDSAGPSASERNGRRRRRRRRWGRRSRRGRRRGGTDNLLGPLRDMVGRRHVLKGQKEPGVTAVAPGHDL